ncbi:MAG: dipeptidase PepV [Alkalibacterium sp.]|uniref:dipeptidase PepV n=1 Tax=Alkalibacterium TaxID=99906 RepID=UPI002649B4A2|nr:dipeptidase PepV [Alkalibacterium sp.]MDN6193913.1 dipeptidase PepV [Alkalibacterium sp.]MDN6294488.1 dipeptidase PepV [Alkalibacterium sp.]MDN6295121.1 dipeptidase PepV [Alkalibacterium sp.]MDN6326917.1 dipeptidase PepV [Alkalibacterium sp.]MDN6385651.1 dipeptidase PepV [Alkalibacterium sp.]
MTQNIDWKAEAAKRKDLFLEDLFNLLKIDSVRDDEKATAEAPVGPGPKEALEAFLELGERDGFETKNVDNWAGHIEYGDGDQLMGVLAHVDVVPTGTGWDTDPFEPVIKNGRLYARGSSDDKGPGVAAYYALKMIKDLDLPVSKKVRFIIGTDEESEWQGIKHYLETEQEPDFGFSPDATFPIINGEKGNATVYIETKGAVDGGSEELIQFESGLRPNMVPQDAVAVVKSKNAEAVQAGLADFLDGLPVTGVAAVEGDQVTLEVTGKAAHGSKPASGVNAATYLARYLSDFDFSKNAKDFLELTTLYLHDDPKGEKLNIAITDEIMGELTSNPGVFAFRANEGGKITVNMRYPQGTTEDKLFESFKEKLSDYEVTLSKADGKVPHYVPANDPLVTTLLDVYGRQTGLDAHEMVIGGGTYGRLMKRGVAYGAMFPNSVDTMHQANEFMAVDDLMNAMAIYAEAIYELIK